MQLFQHFLMLDTHNWLQMLDTGKEVCAVFFDLSKALDFVLHWSLLKNYQSSEIDSIKFLKWLFL